MDVERTMQFILENLAIATAHLENMTERQTEMDEHRKRMDERQSELEAEYTKRILRGRRSTRKRWKSFENGCRGGSIEAATATKRHRSRCFSKNRSAAS